MINQSHLSELEDHSVYQHLETNLSASENQSARTQNPPIKTPKMSFSLRLPASHPDSHVQPNRPRHKAADKIEAQGRVAVIPCGRCYRLRYLCMVGTTAKRCSNCARSGIKLDECNVDRENYREVQLDEEGPSSPETSADSELTDVAMTDPPNTGFNPNRPVADVGSAPASVTQTQPPTLTTDEKVDLLNRKTTRRFQEMTSQADETDNRILELENIVSDLQTRVRALEETVLNLAGTGKNFNPRRSSQGEFAPHEN